MRRVHVALVCALGFGAGAVPACTSNDNALPTASNDAGSSDVYVPSSYDAGGVDAKTSDVAAPIDAPDQDVSDAGSALDAADAADSALENGLVAWWRGENNANDSEGSFNGTLASADDASVTYVAGHSGMAFSLPGANADIDIPDGIIPVTARNYTIAAWTWLNAASLNSQQHWIFYAGSVAGELSLTVDSNNLIDFSVHGSDGTWYGAYLPSGTVPTTGSWVSIVGIRRDTTVELWVGGTMVGSSSIATTLDSYVDDAGTHSSIGGQNRNASQWWFGYLDEIRIYDRALSQSEIQSL